MTQAEEVTSERDLREGIKDVEHRRKVLLKAGFTTCANDKGEMCCRAKSVSTHSGETKVHCRLAAEWLSRERTVRCDHPMLELATAV